MSITAQLLIIVSCLFGQAFFAGIETGVISIHRMRLRHFVREGAAGASLLQAFLENSDRLLGTTLVGTNLCTVVVSVTGASLCTGLLDRGGDTLATVMVTILVLVFGEYLPKSWFHARPLERCRHFVGVLRVAELIFKPVSVAIVGITRWLVPGPRESFSKPVPFVTREDLKVLAREGERDGVLSPRERVMIHRVFELSGKQAGEIMTPRSEMTTICSDASIAEFYETARTSGLTRMPVFDRSKDEFTGVINLFYVLSCGEVDRQRTVGEFARPPLLIPEEMPVDDIFPRLRRSRQPLGLVTARGKSDVVGLVTTEDILEEIVGKL